MSSQSRKIGWLTVIALTVIAGARCSRHGISDVSRIERLIDCDPIVESKDDSKERQAPAVMFAESSDNAAYRLFELEPPVIVAHRGYGALHPENTILAIEKAFELGAAAVEVDIRMTRDGVPILMHDPTVDRTTNGAGRVVDLDFAQIQKLDACSLFGDGWQPCNVPTLSEALATVRDHAGVIFLDLKPPFGSDDLIAVVSHVYCTEMASRTVVLSYDMGVAFQVRQLAPVLPVGLVIEEERAPRDLVRARMWFAAVHKRILERNPLYPSILANHELSTMAWTVSQASEAHFLVSTGATFLISAIPLNDADLNGVRAN